MTILDYLEKIDDTLSHWEDYFHGQEGTDVTEARYNLDKARKQLLIQIVSNSRLTELEEENKKLRFMVENGLGEKDLEDDCC